MEKDKLLILVLLFSIMPFYAMGQSSFSEPTEYASLFYDSNELEDYDTTPTDGLLYSHKWYAKIIVCQKSLIKAEHVTGTSMKGTQMYLYDSKQNLIASSNDNSGTIATWASITKQLDAGTYYIVSQGGNDKNGNIRMRITCSRVPPTIDGRNYIKNMGEVTKGNCSQIQFITKGYMNTCSYSSTQCGDAYATFNVSTPMEIVLCANGSGNVWSYILNSSGTLIKSFYNDNSDTLCKETSANRVVLTPGEYTLVSEVDEWDTGVINVSIAGTLNPKGDTKENAFSIFGKSPSFSFSDALYLSIYSANYFLTKDVVYNLILDSDMFLNFSLSGSIGNPSIYLYDQTGNLVKSGSKIGVFVTKANYVVICTGIPASSAMSPDLIFSVSGNYESQMAEGINYISTTLPIQETTDESLLSIDNSQQTIDYFDGLGTKIQEVRRAFTPSRKDLITQIEYDKIFNKPIVKWLPVPQPNNDGRCITNLSALKYDAKTFYNDSKPDTVTCYENSPLARPSTINKPGDSWDEVNFNIQYGQESGSDIYKYIMDGNGMITNSGTRSSEILSYTYYEDEDEKEHYEFKNDEGQLILSRKNSEDGFGDTYYLYDNCGNLCCVLPPMASELMKKSATYSFSDANSPLALYAYYYTYDSQGNCIAKKLPGMEVIYNVYDKMDQLSLSQSGNQRLSGKWTNYVYDKIGRIVSVSTGKSTSSVDALRNEYSAKSSINAFVEGSEDEIINYYDDYLFLNELTFDQKTKLSYQEKVGYGNQYEVSYRLLTGKKIYLYDAVHSYIMEVYYYDEKGRIVQKHSINHLGGVDCEYMAYSFTGKLLKRLHTHTDGISNKMIQELYAYTYDSAERLLKTTHQIDGNPIMTLSDNVYDELGRLQTNKRNSQSNLITNYTYNIRSWTKSIQNPLFGQTLYYEDSYAGNSPCYGGNISAMQWSSSGDSKNRGYTFNYDGLSRLTAGNYLENGSPSTNYSTSYAYDKQGNITALTRRGATGTTTYGMIDNLTMAYSGNQLVKADDSGENVNLSASMDFKDGSNASTEYFYDANGNLIKDLNKGITSITYNLLNLPQTLTISNSFGSATNTYTYSADGRKLRMLQQGSGSTKQIDYCGNMIYENGSLKRMLVDGGYIENSTYYYYLSDHQGNVRVVANADGSVVQTNHYYPFGMSFTEGNVTSNQPYKYNGKELDTERGLNWYDYGARMYDPALGRWHVADLMEEMKPWASGYMYCLDNPEKYVDPTGLFETKSEGLKYAQEYGGGSAQVLQDTRSGKWFVSMNESGTKPYTSGGTVTRYFGPSSSSFSAGFDELSFGFSASNMGTAFKGMDTFSNVGGVATDVLKATKSLGSIGVWRDYSAVKIYPNGWAGNSIVKTYNIASPLAYSMYFMSVYANLNLYSSGQQSNVSTMYNIGMSTLMLRMPLPVSISYGLGSLTNQMQQNAYKSLINNGHEENPGLFNEDFLH